MQFNLLIQRTLVLFCMVLSIALFATANAQEGKTYVTLNKTQPSETTGKIEVLEFFAYTCPHCKSMEPLVSKWETTLPDDVNVIRVPVAFNASLTELQKLYYTLENLERPDLHPKVFEAMHDQRKSLFKANEIIDWVEQQGMDRQVFTDVFNSFGIQSRVTRANELVKNYNIEATPSLAVGGKYVTSPGMTNSYEATIQQANNLIEKIRNQN